MRRGFAALVSVLLFLLVLLAGTSATADSYQGLNPD
jgi:hypothetical protein